MLCWQEADQAASMSQLRGSFLQFQRAISLQCLQSKLPGAQALRQHVVRLLDLGLQASQFLTMPQVCFGRTGPFWTSKTMQLAPSLQTFQILAMQQLQTSMPTL